jgi:hypothetical protein
VTRRPAKTAAITLALFALAVYVAYIAWIGIRL